MTQEEKKRKAIRKKANTTTTNTATTRDTGRDDGDGDIYIEIKATRYASGCFFVVVWFDDVLASVLPCSLHL